MFQHRTDASRYLKKLSWRTLTIHLVALVSILSGCKDRPVEPSAASQSTKLEPAKPSPPRDIWKKVGVIDVHTHISPTAIPTAVQVSKDFGLQRLVNLSGGNRKDGGLDLWYGMSLELGERFVHCYTPPWRELYRPDGAQRIMHGLVDTVGMGYRCAKISKALGLSLPDQPRSSKLMQVDDPRLDPFWAKAGELGVPVFIHTGDPKAFFEAPTPDNERFEELSVHPSWSFADRSLYPTRRALLAARDRVLARHRQTNFVGVHFANNPEELDYVEQALESHPNLYVDIAARIGEIGRHDARRVRALFVRFQDRILFGTDIGIGQTLMLGSSGKDAPSYGEVAPFYAAHFRFLESSDQSMPNPIPIQGRWNIHPLGLPEEVLRKIYRENAERLIPGLR